MPLRINAKTCSSEILAYGSVEPGPGGHVFLTLSKADGEPSVGSAAQTWQSGVVSRDWAAGHAASDVTSTHLLGQHWSLSNPMMPFKYSTLLAPPTAPIQQVDAPMVMEQLLRGVLPPGCVVHHVYQSDSPDSPPQGINDSSAVDEAA